MTRPADCTVPTPAVDEEGRRADQVEVAQFRQILIWPLALQNPSHTAASSGQHDVTLEPASQIATEVANALNDMRDTSAWRHQPDPLRHLVREHGAEHQTGIVDAQAFGEFVYFHPYVQRFLYEKRPLSDGRLKPAPFHLFQRTDVARVIVDLPADDATVERFAAHVDRLNLYIFDCGVAILALEVVVAGKQNLAAATAKSNIAWGNSLNPLTLADVLRFQNPFRRVYMPYWTKDGRAAEVPARVVFLGDDGKPIPARNAATLDIADLKLAGAVHALDQGSSDGRRQAPIFRHWLDLFPLAVSGQKTDDKAAEARRWMQVVDERIPSLAYVQLAGDKKAVDAVHRGELVRLCFVDTPGPDPYFYDPGFLANFERENCYDRFRAQGTRHLFSGYSYAMVVGDDFAHYARPHFRRHYFQIALLSHLEMAALLTYSNWASEAVAHHRNAAQAGDKVQSAFASASFERGMHSIQEHLLTFVHQYRFTGLSNQMQPQEMQAYWRRHLRLDALFADVSTEIRSATDYLMSLNQSRSAEAGATLAATAVIAAVVGLPLAFLGMNYVNGDQGKIIGIPSDGWTAWGATTFIAAWAMLTMVGGSIPGLLRAAKGSLLGLSSDQKPSPGLPLVQRALGWILVVALAMTAFGHSYGSPWLEKKLIKPAEQKSALPTPPAPPAAAR